jgi:hypothetical protein
MTEGTAENELGVAAARFRLGLQTADTLRALAVRLLDRGYDDDAVVRLAVADDLNTDEVAPLFKRVCAAHAVPVPDASRAIDVVAADWLRRLVAEDLSPEATLTTLFREIDDGLRDDDAQFGASHVGESHDLGELVGARWGYDELHNRPDEISYHDLYGQDALRRLDADAKRFAAAWLSQRPSDE